MSTAKPMPTNAELKTVSTHEASEESTNRETIPFGFLPRKYILPLLFMVWYILTLGYNIYNKKATRIIKAPYYLSLWQFFLGCPYVLFMWFTGIRKMPILSRSDLLKLAPLAVFHSMTHVCAVISMGAGHVSFTHIVKAGEPVSTAILGMIVLQDFFPWQVYVSMLPIIAGVAITACGGEGGFQWIAFFGALGSMLGSSLRAIYSKKVMNGEPVGENLTPANMYGVLTLMSTLGWGIFAIPYGYSEFAKGLESIDSALTAPYFFYATLSALCYYLYNEAAFVTLHKVAPLTHSVANTFKRVFIIVGSVFFLGEYMKLRGWIGGTIAVLGVFVYSLVKQHYKK